MQPQTRYEIAASKNLSKEQPHVFLRLQNGLLTKKLSVPRSCLAGEYKVPVLSRMKMSVVTDAQEYIHPMKNTPCLVFRWDQRSYQSSLPIMDLVDVYLI